ncbi:MAG TPA: 1-deoxy-D-xylulose-5-phosphate synthase [Anaeromyxobacteraceae bacterium]|jgi:1-deoxy-D-xylulose-5-phosphate synthase
MARLLDGIDSPADLKKLPAEDLPRLCQEIRDEIIETCARNGGHLGSSLGAVEINVALHYVFDSPGDRLVWDVGHQAYAHKILTGRRERFRTIRTEGGLAGFPERQESEHDAFGVGHASTAVSAALGMIEARRLRGQEGKVVAVVGDGALTGGIAFEGLNQAGYLKRDLIVVLNDNEMSISPNVGAMSEWLSKKFTSRTYARWRRSVKGFLGKVPRGGEAIEVIRHGITAAKALFTPGVLFEGLGFHYVGPADGHDVAALVETFRKLATFEGPVLFHLVTTKGKGYHPAESDLATRGHGLSFFDPKTGRSRKAAARTFTDVFAEAVCEQMQRDDRVVAITAAMLEGTGLVKAKKLHPERTYDVGIAEQHAVTFAAGLACEGMRPVVAIYSTFLQRAYDQIIHDVALQKLPVTFALDRGGLVGADGKTHQGAFDVSYLRCVPNFVVMAPSDENEMRHMLATALACDGPAALRFPRGGALGVPMDPEPRALPLGRGRLLKDGGARPDVAVLALGPCAHAAAAAAEALARDGIAATVVDARFAKPLDEDLLCAAAAAAHRVVTVEESALAGGFGAAVLELLERKGLLPRVQVRRIGLPDQFVTHGDVQKQRAQLGLDAAGIARACREITGIQPNVAEKGLA